MPMLLNLLYLFALVLLSPWLLWRACATGKHRRGMWQKLTGVGCPTPRSDRPVAWFHGVSVGEVHLLRQVVAAFRQRQPGWDCVVSTTTDTGFDECRKHFPDLPVFFWPLDFSWAVRRALGTVRPDLVVLAECELWPNFLLAAREHGTRVAVVNARMSPRSLARFQKLRWLARPLLERIDLFAVQTLDYAAAFAELGVAPSRIQVTGSVKYDGVLADRDHPRTRELAELLAIGPEDLVWVAGSTQAPEERIVLDIFRRARLEHPRLRLLIVPRQKDRFDEVAGLVERSGLPFVRRSRLPGPTSEPIILVDTIGELAHLWGLAHVAFVGGSLDGKRGGQNMIEPAACGAAVVFGPHVWNFKETSTRLVGAEAAIQVKDAAELEAVIRRLLGDPAERGRLARAARAFVQSQQGATERTIDLLARVSGKASRAA